MSLKSVPHSLLLLPASALLPLTWIYFCSHLLLLHLPSSCHRNLTKKQIWPCPSQLKILLVSNTLLNRVQTPWHGRQSPVSPGLGHQFPVCIQAVTIPLALHPTLLLHMVLSCWKSSVHVCWFVLSQHPLLLLVLPASHKPSAFLLNPCVFHMGGSRSPLPPFRPSQIV